jgi:hypothetical protein
LYTLSNIFYLQTNLGNFFFSSSGRPIIPDRKYKNITARLQMIQFKEIFNFQFDVIINKPIMAITIQRKI